MNSSSLANAFASGCVVFVFFADACCVCIAPLATLTFNIYHVFLEMVTTDMIGITRTTRWTCQYFYNPTIYYKCSFFRLLVMIDTNCDSINYANVVCSCDMLLLLLLLVSFFLPPSINSSHS
jgi:hypothetical protein